MTKLKLKTFNKVFFNSRIKSESSLIWHNWESFKDKKWYKKCTNCYNFLEIVSMAAINYLVRKLIYITVNNSIMQNSRIKLSSQLCSTIFLKPRRSNFTSSVTCNTLVIAYSFDPITWLRFHNFSHFWKKPLHFPLNFTFPFLYDSPILSFIQQEIYYCIPKFYGLNFRKSYKNFTGVLYGKLYSVCLLSIHFMSLVSFYNPWKHQKTSGFFYVSRVYRHQKCFQGV